MSTEMKPNIGATMTIIHRAVSRGLDESLRQSTVFLVSGFPDDHTRHGFLTYVGSLHKVIDSHHQGEDEVAFPYLKQVLPDAPYDGLLAEHVEMEAFLDELGRAVESLEASAEDPSLTRLGQVLSMLIGLWHPHIEKEEQYLYDPEKTAPLMSPEEHLELNRNLARHAASLGNMEVKVPFILYNLPPDDRAVFARGLPPAMVQELVPTVWKPRWEPMLPFLLP